MATLSGTKIFDRLKSRIKDISDISEAEKVDMLNIVNDRVYRAAYDNSPDTYATTETITIVSGTSSYNLSSNFLTVSKNNLGVFDLDSDGNSNDNLKLKKTFYGAQSQGYFITGDTTKVLNITPEPTQADSYIVRYIPILTALTASTENVLLSYDWLALYRAGILEEYGFFDLNNEEEQGGEARYIAIEKELFGNLDPMPETYEMIDTATAM